MKKINVAILGFGTIGTGTYKVLQMNKETITKNTGADIEVIKILDKDLTRDRGVAVPAGVMTDKADEVFCNDDINIVVEVMGGIEPATSFMIEAMNHGKSVVTANKAAVAANYDKLSAAAKANNVEFKFEASVGGGIPILNAITTVLGGNEFTEVMGILNGTTNYILTKMTEEGLPYADVLKTAQQLGFAEADPTADVEGIDVANKLSILMCLAFDKYVKPADIPTVGISKITAEDIEAAKAEGCKIKLIAHAKYENGALEYSVKPMNIPNSHPLAGVSNEFNAVYITGNAVDELMFYGKGAGALPTGSAVVGDIIEIAKVL